MGCGPDAVAVGGAQIFQFSCRSRITSLYRSCGLGRSQVARMFILWVASAIFDDGGWLWGVRGGGVAISQQPNTLVVAGGGCSSEANGSKPEFRRPIFSACIRFSVFH